MSGSAGSPADSHSPRPPCAPRPALSPPAPLPPCSDPSPSCCLLPTGRTQSCRGGRVGRMGSCALSPWCPALDRREWLGERTCLLEWYLGCYVGSELINHHWPRCNTRLFSLAADRCLLYRFHPAGFHARRRSLPRTESQLIVTLRISSKLCRKLAYLSSNLVPALAYLNVYYLTHGGIRDRAFLYLVEE